ncbi:LysR family transcriptional regulator [Altererythrobacter xixiisoli]|uniref:LysR family transcriptional regulator n=1 Tax=Croceibacterium xixiisoli TaxID=1476466 RepID=A0A6I4TZN2_9SPHN|nr:LysR family transcriptional regulator [Croceibacterium xixiisoli]
MRVTRIIGVTPILARFDPNLLIILAQLLRTRSVTRTAAQLRTSQPAVSRALARLRSLLDDPLLVRTGNGMTLTRRAEDLVEPVQLWLASTMTLLDPPTFEPATLERRFRVASTDFGVMAVVAPMLPEFMTLAPRAAIEIVPLKGSMGDELASGEVDLLVSGLDSDPSLAHEQFLFMEDFSCLFRHDHPLAQTPGQLGIEEFLDWPHVSFTVGEHDFDRVDARLGVAGARRRVVASIPYFGIAPGIVGSADAIMTLPSRAARSFAATYDLAIRQAPKEIGALKYQLLWHARTARDPASIWLRDLMAKSFSE